MNYEERLKTYTNALVSYGEERQIIKCLEELAECQQVICKVLYAEDTFDHMAEEIADVTIMLEQMRMIFCIDEKVSAYMDAKVQRLDDNLRDPKGRSE